MLPASSSWHSQGATGGLAEWKTSLASKEVKTHKVKVKPGQWRPHSNWSLSWGCCGGVICGTCCWMSNSRAFPLLSGSVTEHKQSPWKWGEGEEVGDQFPCGWTSCQPFLKEPGPAHPRKAVTRAAKDITEWISGALAEPWEGQAESTM